MDKQLRIPKRHASLEKRKARAGYLFVAPFLIGVLLIYLPILLDSIRFSFNNVNIAFNPATNNRIIVLSPQGFKFYAEAFTTDPQFVTKLLSGIQQLIFEVPAVIIFSLFIAVVLNQKMLGRAAFRVIFFIPVIISTGLMESISAGDLMSSVAEGGIDDGSGGSGASQIISALDVELLFESMKVGGDLVKYVVSLVNNVYNIINYSGVQMLIFLAGLQSISPAIYEASEIEGATAWETFWKITFPMISPMILVNTVYTIIDSFTKRSNVTMAYISSIYSGNESKATAMSWIYFLVVILIIAVVAGIASTFIFYQRKD